MSALNTTPDPPPAYYTQGSYQQGAGGLQSVGVPSTQTATDEAYARRLQQEEVRSAQQQQQQQVLPTTTGQPVQATDGTQYVAMYPPSSVFNSADLGVSGNFLSPNEARLMEAFSLGRTIRILAILDGLLLLLNCAWFPILFLLILWAPVSGWMAGTRFSVGWTYVYCCYYVMRLSVDVAYIILSYYWFVFVFVVNLVVSTYIFRFAKILNSLTPAEIEQLRNPAAAFTQQSQYRRQQPFITL